MVGSHDKPTITVTDLWRGKKQQAGHVLSVCVSGLTSHGEQIAIVTDEERT